MTNKTEVYGVVLYVNNQKGTAVIWCEDQGDLAYVTPGDDTAQLGTDIDAGDLILCSIDEADLECRRVRQMRRVEYRSHKALPRMLVRREPAARASNVVPIKSGAREVSPGRTSYVA